MIRATPTRPDLEAVMTRSGFARWFTTLSIAAVTFTVTPLMAASAQPRRPDLKLRVSTHHGFMPLDLALDGSIGAEDRSAFQSCLVTVERTYTTPGGQELNSKKESPCIESASTTNVPESFKMKVSLDEPGTYSYRLVLVSPAG